MNVKPQQKRGGGGGSKADRARAKRKANQIAQSDSAMPSKESYVDVVEKLQREDKLPANWIGSKSANSLLAMLSITGICS